MNKHLYFGEQELSTVDYETPLVKAVRKTASSPLTVLAAVFLMLGSAVFIAYYGLFYKGTNFVYSGIIFVLMFLQSIFLFAFYGEGKKKNSFFKANSLVFAAIVQIIKSVIFILTAYYLIFYQYKRFVLIKYIRVKLFWPAVAVTATVALGALITAFAILSIRRAAVNNYPKKEFVIIAAAVNFAAAIIGVGLAAVSVCWNYAAAVLSRHILFPYSNYLFVPLGILLIAVEYLFLGIIFVKYFKAVKKESK